MTKLKRLISFIIVGTIAFAVDIAVLTALHWLGVTPLAARLLSIALAMVVAWWLNRTFTFPRNTPPTPREFMRYAALGWASAALNYAVFSTLLLTGMATNAVTATTISTLAAMAFSFTGMKRFVFK